MLVEITSWEIYRKLTEFDAKTFCCCKSAKITRSGFSLWIQLVGKFTEKKITEKLMTEFYNLMERCDDILLL